MPSVQNRRPNPLMPPVPPGVTPPTVGPGSAARAFNEAVIDPALRANNAIGAQNRQQIAGFVGGVGNALNQQDPSRVPPGTPAQVAGGLTTAAQGLGAQIGGNIASGLNQVNPNSPVSPPYGGEGSLQRTVGSAIFGVRPELNPTARPRPQDHEGGYTPTPPIQFAGLPPSPLEALAMHPPAPPPPPAPVAPGPAPSGESPQGAAGPFPVSFNSPFAPPGRFPAFPPQPDAAPPGPTPYGAPAAGGLGPYQPRVGAGPLANPVASPYASNSGFDGVRRSLPTVFEPNANLAKSVQDMHARNNPDRALRPDAGPLSPTLQSLADGGKPITGPTGAGNASAAYAANGRPMTNEEAQSNYKNSPADSKYQPNKTVGGNFGGPSPTTYASGDQVLKDIAKDKINNASQPLNVAIGNGMLQGRGNQTQKPEHDFGLGTPFSALGNKYTKNDKGQIGRGSGFSGTDEAKADAAKAQLASPERQQYLNNRKGDMAFRKSEVVNNALAGKEARRFRMGDVSAGEQLAFENPQANAYRDVGMAQAQAQGDRFSADRRLREKQLNQQHEVGMGRNDAIKEASRNKISADALANGKPDPFATPGKGDKAYADKVAEGDSIDLTGKTLEEQKKMVAHLPPETQARILNEQANRDIQGKAFNDIRSGPGRDPFMNTLAYPFDAIASWLGGRPKTDYARPRKASLAGQ